MGTGEGPDQISFRPCIDICLNATALIRVSNARIHGASARSILVAGDYTELDF